MWYSCTVVLILANKVLMSEGRFPLPIFLTFLHTCASYFCCELLVTFGWTHRLNARDWRQSVRVFALSQAHALSILFSVASLQYIEVSFEQALSASTPFFTALFGYVILGRVERQRTWITLIPVICGALMSLHGELRLSSLGMSLVFAANTARALKSCLQELLLKDELVSISLRRVKLSATWFAKIITLPCFPAGLYQSIAVDELNVRCFHVAPVNSY